jgi:hypothetical protein
VEEDGKRFKRKASEFVNHDPHIFTRDREAKHPAQEM